MFTSLGDEGSGRSTVSLPTRGHGVGSLGRSLADFTAVILERSREADRSRTLTAQLEHALTSRVVIEQAKGVLATRRAMTPDEAFDRLRKHARSRQRPLRDVAGEVVAGYADPELTDPVS
ncbi:ANTAR domain-containing protein [Streptomyces sp. NPDC005492]|uniref:ANTAR domain-containing response regulator n=1 Tax=Streptomyces sp. NPDC005492 TaxID=3156883 RepID=UPI0033AB049C